MSRACEVQAPDSVLPVAHEGLSPLRYRFQASQPVAERQEIMLAKILYIAHFESGLLGVAEQGCNGNQIAVREDVNIREGGRVRLRAVSSPSDPMIEKHSPWLQEIKRRLEIFRQFAFPHVLNHADAH